MKRLPVLIVAIALAMMAVVAGCGRTPRYDGRLVAADSLMRSAPDSALAIVEGIDRDSLAADFDRAYHDLLLTQAHYRCYVTAASDSDINRALAYYLAHSGEREKLTRAYIYKGAVMDELGHPDSAMLYYKHAEAVADTNDYFNLGYAKLRMGALYNSHYSMGSKETLKYEEALDCFRLAEDSVYMLVCLNNLGCLYRKSKPDTAETILQEAYALARQLRDTTRMIYNNWSLVELDFNQGRYEEAHHLLLEAINYGIGRFDYTFFFTAANVYAKMGILDTAIMYFAQASVNRSGDQSLFDMHRLESLGVLALSRKDTISFLRYKNESDKIADSLKVKSRKLDILHTEADYDNELMRQHKNAFYKMVHSYHLFIVLGILILAVLALLHYHSRHRYDKLILDLKKENQSQSLDLKALQHNIQELKISDAELKESLASHMELMRNVIEACYHFPKSTLTKNIQEIVHYQNENKELWKKLYTYINRVNNNIMDDAKRRCPRLNESDLMLLALSSMGYSCAQIAIIMGYNNATTIGGNRQRLAKKMNLDCSLMEFVKKYKSKE